MKINKNYYIVVWKPNKQTDFNKVNKVINFFEKIGYEYKEFSDKFSDDHILILRTDGIMTLDHSTREYMKGYHPDYEELKLDFDKID